MGGVSSTAGSCRGPEGSSVSSSHAAALAPLLLLMPHLGEQYRAPARNTGKRQLSAAQWGVHSHGEVTIYSINHRVLAITQGVMDSFGHPSRRFPTRSARGRRECEKLMAMTSSDGPS
jgi:hypothetical protein